LAILKGLPKVQDRDLKNQKSERNPRNWIKISVFKMPKDSLNPTFGNPPRFAKGKAGLFFLPLFNYF
jgi:hypothetical protein